jgi:hypothetical protein
MQRLLRGETQVLARDSGRSPDDVVYNAADTWSGMKSTICERLAGVGVRVYGLGKYQRTPSCDLARSLRDVRVMLLSGNESDPWRRSTLEVAPCFVPPPEIRRDLSLTGANLPNSTGEQEESYDRPVIEFFDKALR